MNEVATVGTTLQDIRDILQLGVDMMSRENNRLKELNRSLLSLKKSLDTTARRKLAEPSAPSSETLAPITGLYQTTIGTLQSGLDEMRMGDIEETLKTLGDLAEQYSSAEYGGRLKDEEEVVAGLEARFTRLEEKLKERQKKTGRIMTSSPMGSLKSCSFFAENLPDIGFNTDFIRKDTEVQTKRVDGSTTFLGAVDSFITSITDPVTLAHMLRTGAQGMGKEDTPMLAQICHKLCKCEMGAVLLGKEVNELLASISYDDFCCLREAGAMRLFGYFMFQLAPQNIPVQETSSAAVNEQK